MTDIKEIAKEKWRIVCDDIAVTYAFDMSAGIRMDEFTNLGEENFSYCRTQKTENIEKNTIVQVDSINADTSLCGTGTVLPIVNCDEAIENGRPPFSFKLVSASFGEGVYNKCRVKRLDVVIEALLYKLYFHAVAFPGVSVIKQWWEVENTSVARTNGFKIHPFSGDVRIDDYRRSYWVTSVGGGHTRPTQGEMLRRMIGLLQTYKYDGNMTGEYSPIFLFECEEEPKDGYMVAMDYLGKWNFTVNCVADGYNYSFTADDDMQVNLMPKEKMSLPAITLSAYRGGKENLAKHLYDWQYKYMFDLTSDKTFAAARDLAHWYCEDKVAHESFASRTSDFDLNGIDEVAFVAAKGFWSDAGWYLAQKLGYGYIFCNSLNGPDFRDSVKYAEKSGISYTLWFAGKPLDAIMETKASWWGDFEWRTDAFNARNQKEYDLAVKKVEKYLDKSPERSFHTCDGGANYSHCFEIQRLSTYNYMSDLSSSPYKNYYNSFYEIPDKQAECMAAFGKLFSKYNGSSTLAPFYYSADAIDVGKFVFDEGHIYSSFTNVPMGMGGNRRYVKPENYEITRSLYAIYNYMVANGVAGKDCYMLHPRVFGDNEYNYRLRTSHDFSKAVLIIGHGCGRDVTVYPDGLIADMKYEIEFHTSGKKLVMTGKELSEKGFVIPKDSLSDLVWFNLPTRPFGSKCSTPKAPRAVYKRLENNIKKNGVGIYIDAPDDDALYYYSVERDGKEIGKTATGRFFFDHSPDFDIDAKYTVKAVGYNENASKAVVAEALASDIKYIAAAGCYSGEVDVYKGWSFEYSDNMKDFSPMKRIPSPGDPSGDFGGTPNRPGGVEGNFEACGNTRCARGYHQVGSKISSHTYTSEIDGTVRVVGTVRRDYFTDESAVPVKAYIYKNGEKLWSCKIAPFEKEAKVHDLTVQLKKGDKLRFIVDKVKGQRETVYQYEDDAVIVGWLPRIILDVKESKNGGTVVKSLNARGNYSESFKASGISRIAVKLIADSEFMNECYAEIKIGGRTLCKRFDVVKNSRNGECIKYFANILPTDGKIAVEIKTENATLVEIKAVPDNGFIGFYTAAAKDFCCYDGEIWKSVGFVGGTVSHSDRFVDVPMPTLLDEGLAHTARLGKDIKFSTELPEGIYSVRVKAANIWEKDGRKPIFDIIIGGKVVKKDFDLDRFAEGKPIDCVLRFDGIIPENGKITIEFKAYGRDFAAISGIAID